MKRYAFIVLAGAILLLIVLGIASKGMAHPEETLDKVTLPNFYLSQLDSTQVALHAIEYENDLIVSLINSECEICHTQVDEFYKRAHKLDGVKIILISYQNIEDIKEFAKNYPDPPFTFWKADFEMLNTQFEGMGTPQARLFNGQKEMIKKINGIARIAHIKKYFEQAQGE